MALIDALKAIAAQLIVLHHLAFYGPMSDAALEWIPGLISWFYDYGRMAVQAFLVMAGFLAARSLAPEGALRVARPLVTLFRRYLSLVLPFLAALLCAIAAAALARQLMRHDAIPAAPTLLQFLKHALLIHGITGTESLSAGVWYIAIDFQLFLLLLACLWLSRFLPFARWSGLFLVAGLTLVSLFYFNRDPTLDDWGFYFFGAYGLGVLAFWISGQKRFGGLIALFIFAAVLALLVEYRLRLVIALATAVLLAFAHRFAWMHQPRSRVLGWLGRTSYALFLIHFPVLLLVGAVVHRLAPLSPTLNLLGMIFAWLASLICAWAFSRWVECPCRAIVGKLHYASSPGSPAQ
ncbi:MAG: Acyltransferase family protein [Betaproteobacteria bacterium ADurb.Bin341]|nr:MAG: Acyltransferase family protein [Betaproteobacteria bacterium ADurb.Bin341]